MQLNYFFSGIVSAMKERRRKLLPGIVERSRVSLM
jgi:hypothetical protein